MSEYFVRATVVRDGLTIDNIEFRHGVAIVIPEVLAESLGDAVKVEERPTLRAKVPNILVGRRVLALGEEAPAPNLGTAKRFAKEGRAEFVNADLFDSTYKDPGEEPTLPVKTVGHVLINPASAMSQVYPIGSVLNLPRRRAVELVRDGAAEALGWRALRKKVRTLHAGAQIGGRLYPFGEVVEADLAAAEIAINIGHAAPYAEPSGEGRASKKKNS
jgi:hypothetical protein